MFNRQQVYQSCLLAASRGIDCGAFGNATSSTNKGQYMSPFYQEIASKYNKEASSLGETLCYQLYVASGNQVSL